MKSTLIVSRARKLRRNLTDAEKKLWKILRGRQFAGFKFRRQESIGNYIVDFICYEKGLIVEIDGGQHSEKQIDDEKRTRWLESQGFQVIRFWNHHVLKETAAIAQGIAEVLRK